MRRIFTGALFGALGLLLAVGPVSAQVLVGFDDVGSGMVEYPISNGYKGFNWNNFGAVHEDLSPGSGYDKGTVSGHYTGFNGFGAPASLSRSTAFTFNSGYFTSAWYNNNVLTINGLLGGVVMFTRSLTLNTAGPIFEVFNWSGIDQLAFSTSAQHFAGDDFLFDAAQTTVPEPISMALLGTGLAGVAAARRRRRNNSESV